MRPDKLVYFLIDTYQVNNNMRLSSSNAATYCSYVSFSCHLSWEISIVANMNNILKLTEMQWFKNEFSCKATERPTAGRSISVGILLQKFP